MVKDINFKHSEHARILVRRDSGIYIIEIYVGALKQTFQGEILLRESHPIIGRTRPSGVLHNRGFAIL